MGRHCPTNRSHLSYPLFDSKVKLPIPSTKSGYDVKRETWTVIPQDLGTVIDLTPRFSTLAGVEAGGGIVGICHKLSFDESMLALLDVNTLYSRLLQYKSVRSYDNFFIPRGSVPE